MAKGKEQQGNVGEDEQELGRDGSGGKKNPKGVKRKKLSPRAKVKKAQMSVLGKMNRILAGNCKSASAGNYKCAEFVLDWSGITEIRTPLAKPRKKALVAGLMKEGRKKSEDADDEE